MLELTVWFVENIKKIKASYGVVEYIDNYVPHFYRLYSIVFCIYLHILDFFHNM